MFPRKYQIFMGNCGGKTIVKSNFRFLTAFVVTGDKEKAGKDRTFAGRIEMKGERAYA